MSPCKVDASRQQCLCSTSGGHVESNSFSLLVSVSARQVVMTFAEIATNDFALLRTIILTSDTQKREYVDDRSVCIRGEVLAGRGGGMSGIVNRISATSSAPGQTLSPCRAHLMARFGVVGFKVDWTHCKTNNHDIHRAANDGKENTRQNNSTHDASDKLGDPICFHRRNFQAVNFRIKYAKQPVTPPTTRLVMRRMFDTKASETITVQPRFSKSSDEC
eukprot:scaffold3849_cov179-Amphora_coffeaeformis.AAC.9